MSVTHLPKATPLPRPYTSYHLFFQLEREYILQSLLGHRPSLASKEVFDARDRSSYRGPPLPSRYAGLVLPRDWHIPGKTRRRKRVHRRTHGKIGFRELNERVSEAWSVADGETRGFCASLAGIQLEGYRAAKGTVAGRKPSGEKRENDKGGTPQATKANAPGDSEDPVASFDWVDGPRMEETASDDLDDGSSPMISRMVSQESIHREEEGCPLATGAKSPLAEVHIEDSEILNIWKRTRSIAVEEEGPRAWSPPVPPFRQPSSPAPALCQLSSPVPALCQLCAEIPNDPPPPLAEEEEGARMSFIDAEYERFKEIGKRFATVRRGPSPDEIERLASFALQA